MYPSGLSHGLQNPLRERHTWTVIRYQISRSSAAFCSLFKRRNVIRGPSIQNVRPGRGTRQQPELWIGDLLVHFGHRLNRGTVRLFDCSLHYKSRSVLLTALLLSLWDQEIICRAGWILVGFNADGKDEYDLEIEFKNNAATVAFQMRWLQAMTSYQVDYTPPSGKDRKARVRVSRADDGEQVWTRELSDEGVYLRAKWFTGSSDTTSTSIGNSLIPGNSLIQGDGGLTSLRLNTPSSSRLSSSRSTRIRLLQIIDARAISLAGLLEPCRTYQHRQHPSA